jgi:hypothetical protein
MPTGIWELQCSFTDLDAAIAQYPHHKVAGWIAFKREPVAPGFVRYHLSQDDLGDRMGMIELRGNEKRVDMSIAAPAFLSSRDATDEELANARTTSDSDEQRKKLMEIMKRLSDDHRELARRRREHFENVTSDLLQYLSQDRILGASTAQAWKSEGAQAATNDAKLLSPASGNAIQEENQWHKGKTLPTKPSKKRQTQLRKFEAVYELSCYRIAMLDKTGKIPSMKSAMEKVKIGEKKVKELALELHRHWDTPSYRQVWQFDDAQGILTKRDYTKADEAKILAILAV